MPSSSLILSALLSASPASVTDLVDPATDEVVLSGERWRSLQPERQRLPGPMVLRRELRIERVEGGVEVQGRWWVSTVREAWFANGIIGPDAHVRSVTWDGRDAAVWTGAQGSLVVERLGADHEARLELRAFVPGNPEGGLTLPLLGAPRGTVELVGFGPEVTLTGVDDDRPVVEKGGRLSTGAGPLRLAVKPPATRQRGPVVVAHVGVGVTVGDAEVRGRARVRWEIRQGSREELRLTVGGVGDDLQVEGPQVSNWRREGSEVLVDLSAPTEGRVDLDLSWSVAAPPGAEASLPLPLLTPHDVFRSDAAVQVARDGEVDVRPELSAWSPIASVQLPDWAEGLVEGTPTSAFSRPRVEGGDGTLSLLRLEPVPGPPMVVEVADVHVATTAEGRALMRVRYEIRNERASHLMVTPPPGMRPVGVTVAGRLVRPSWVDGSLRIPLKRSLETVQGALTVPVTVGLLGEEDDAWEARERRELVLPAVDAPVTVGRVTLHLPPRYRSLLEPGQGAVVDEFDRGEGVGYGLDDDRRVARADQVFAQAIDAWNANDFEEAQAQLDEMSGLGAYGSNVDGLQANVWLVRPPPEPEPQPEPDEPMAMDEMTVYDFEDDDIDGELLEVQGGSLPRRRRSKLGNSMPKPAPPAQSSALERRIRAQARARSGKKKVSFERRKRKAKQYKDEGNYEAAAEEYRAAIEESRDLDALEDEESVEYEFEADQLADELREVEAASDDGGGGGGGDDASDFLFTNGELDRVSAAAVRWLGLDELDGDGELEIVDEDDAAPESPSQTDVQDPLAGAVVVVPWSGATVRYQVLLLSPDESRALRIDARRRRGDRHRR